MLRGGAERVGGEGEGFKATFGEWPKENIFFVVRKTFLSAFTLPFSSLLFTTDQHCRIDSYQADFSYQWDFPAS